MKKIYITLEKINKLIKTQPWFDFEIISYTGYELKIGGSIDLHIENNYLLIITFTDIFLISSLESWHTDISQDCLKVLNGKKNYEINRKFQVEQGNHIFTFSIEDHNDDLYHIIARDISFVLVT